MKISKLEFVKKHGYFVPDLHEKYIKEEEASPENKSLKKLLN